MPPYARRADLGSRCQSPSRSRGECPDGGERDRKPGRAIVDLVDELVEGLLDLEHGQQSVADRVFNRQDWGGGSGGKVALEKRRAHRSAELNGRLFDSPVGFATEVFFGRERGGVGKRSQHARHVAQGTVSTTSLWQRACGLALEVEDHEITVRLPQHLTEVIVAVVADARTGVSRDRVEKSARTIHE